MIDSDMSAEDFFDYLKELGIKHGKICCLNFLTTTQELSLPDAVFIYDCFVKL